jgi:hypothetical protein
MALPVKDEVELIVSEAQRKVSDRFDKSSQMVDNFYRLLTEALGRLQSSLEDIKTRDVDVTIDDPPRQPTFDELSNRIPDMSSIENMIERFLSEIENITPPGNVLLKDISTALLDRIIAEDPTTNRPNITYRPVDPTPAVNPPPFTGDITPSNLTFVYPLFNYTEAPYTSAIKTRIESYVLNVLNNGGTGVNDAVQTALFQKDSERAEQARSDAVNTAITEWSKRGKKMPDGDILDTVARITIELGIKRIDVSRDILIKAWELEQANIFKSLDVSISLETQLINSANNLNQRAFEALKMIADIAFKVIDAEIKKVELSIEEKKMQLTLWEGRVKSELVKLEVYKAYLEGRKIEAEVDQINLELYKTDISVFQSRIEAAKSIIQAIVAYNDGLLKQQGSLTDIYKTMSEVGISKADIGIKGIAAESEVFKAIASAYETLGNLAVKEYDANIQQGIAEAQLQLKNIEIEIANYEKLKTLLVTTLDHTTQVLAQGVAGALAGTSAQVHLGASGSAGESYGYNVSHTET